MQQQTLTTDVMIVGGGLVGCASALSLKQLGYEVALIEQHIPQFSQDTPQEWDARIYAISPGNMAWLSALGVWQTLDASRICTVEKMDIHGDEGGHLCFDAYETHQPGLSYIVESRNLHQALWQAMQATGVQVLANVKVDAIQTSHNNAKVRFNDGTVWQTQLLIGADGGRSWLRAQLGIPVHLNKYQQMGVVANFTTEKSHQQIAHQWFYPESILAYLPLPERRMSMVWSTSQQHAAELLAIDHDSFVRQVTDAGHAVLGKMQCITKPMAFPLNLQIAQSMTSNAAILMGDAAHLVHPLAGQGVNLGFRDAACFAKLVETKASLEGLGDKTLLRRYERARQTDIQAMKTVTNGLHHLFLNTQQSWIKALRNKGMTWVNQQSAIKKVLIQQAIL